MTNPGRLRIAGLSSRPIRILEKQARWKQKTGFEAGFSTQGKWREWRGSNP